jgi:membrane protein YqaA with SNARE-associated domain
MTSQKDNIVTRTTEHINWRRLIITFIIFIGISFILTFTFQKLASKFPPLDHIWLAYLTVFLVSFVSNLTIIAPVPFALSIMSTAATQWNTGWEPISIALFASVGASLGELSGYYAGRLGRKIAIPESALWHSRFERWIKRYGFWAIFGLSFQPVLPFDIAGLIAGAARMPLRIFLSASFLGRFPKYIIFAYIGAGVIKHLPFV